MICLTAPQVFDLCDRDANGFITKDELATVCQQVSDEEVAASVLDNVMMCLDSNNDGRISFDEFKAGFEVREGRRRRGVKVREGKDIHFRKFRGGARRR